MTDAWLLRVVDELRDCLGDAVACSSEQS
jgi:hypothetical protein